jgi:hypothetical protein
MVSCCNVKFLWNKCMFYGQNNIFLCMFPCSWMKLDSFYRKIESWLEDGYLCRDKIIQWLQGVVDRVLRNVNWPRNVMVRIVSLHCNSSVIFVNVGSLCLLVCWEAFSRAKVPGAWSWLLRSASEVKNVRCFNITPFFARARMGPPPTLSLSLSLSHLWFYDIIFMNTMKHVGCSPHLKHYNNWVPSFLCTRIFCLNSMTASWNNNFTP